MVHVVVVVVAAVAAIAIVAVAVAIAVGVGVAEVTVPLGHQYSALRIIKSITFKPPLTELWSTFEILLDVVGQQHMV